MPFIRQTRDKRGFECTYVMHVARAANGSQRTRVLYLFRTPASLNVGRIALDAEVKEALEHTHPDLSFDWNVLTRDAAATRVEPPPPRHSRGQRPRSPAPVARPAPAPLQIVLPADDQSLLGRVLGASEAARLRARHGELVQRVGRRARSPEERERLLEGARRLNPDGWPDEAVIRAQASTMDQACGAIAAELPTRRRGRRGGRRQPDDVVPAPSGIMAKGGESHEQSVEARVDGPRDAPDSGGDTGRGAAGAEADISRRD